MFLQANKSYIVDLLAVKDITALIQQMCNDHSVFYVLCFIGLQLSVTMDFTFIHSSIFNINVDPNLLTDAKRRLI